VRYIGAVLGLPLEKGFRLSVIGIISDKNKVQAWRGALKRQIRGRSG